jgi:hypothetical protein
VIDKIQETEMGVRCSMSLDLDPDISGARQTMGWEGLWLMSMTDPDGFHNRPWSRMTSSCHKPSETLSARCSLIYMSTGAQRNPHARRAGRKSTNDPPER